MNKLNFLFALILVSILIIGFSISDFNLKIVAQNSSKNLDIIFKVAGVWSNYSGSLLIIILCFTVNKFIASNKIKNDEDFRESFDFHFTILLLSFVLFCFVFGSPFGINKLGEQGFLNPLLHDGMMLFHPPIFYFGFFGYATIFYFAISFAINPKTNKKKFCNVVGIVNAICFGFLTIGMVLGSIWAHYEFGWGGFWSWDHVENIALICWLLSLALCHASLSYNLHFVFFLSIIIFPINIFGHYIIKSSIVDSVHSFLKSPNDIAIFLLFCLFFVQLLYFGWIYIKKNMLKRYSYAHQIIQSKFSSGAVLNFILILMAAILILSILMSIHLKDNDNFYFTSFIGTNFYNRFILPLFFILILLFFVPKNFNFSRYHLILLAVFYGSSVLSSVWHKIYIVVIFIIFLKLIFSIGKQKSYGDIIHLLFIFASVGLFLHFSFSNEKLFLVKNGDKIKLSNKKIYINGSYAKKDTQNNVTKGLIINLYKNDKLQKVLKPYQKYIANTDFISIKSSIWFGLVSNLMILINNIDSDGLYLICVIENYGLNIFWASFFILGLLCLGFGIKKIVSFHF